MIPPHTARHTAPGTPSSSDAPAGGILPAENLLRHEASPYLLQHRDNPVHWRAWGPAALGEARASGKPILLSVGYAACHWCHVMAHESFEDPATAEVMNRHFVNIKVDREERPDLDQIHQQALSLLGEQGGWPLTLFLTAEAEPFFGGTYYPPQARWGRPGFRDVLEGIAHIHGQEPDKVQTNVAAIRQALHRINRPEPGAPLNADDRRRAADGLLAAMDLTNGGIGGAPKFPNVPQLLFLWREGRRSGEPALTNAVTRTLDALCQGGIYDHLAGGFARYATDDRWLVPHFEKMLYDNALLLELLAEAWAVTGSPLWRQRASETVAWLTREMSAPAVIVADGQRIDGGFTAALDADAGGREGAHAVWSLDEVRDVLAAAGRDLDLFARVDEVSAGGNWEGHTILHRRHEGGRRAGAGGGGRGDGELLDAASEAELALCREVLLQRRQTRVQPMRDHKVLADWNAMAIRALARAGAILDEPRWIARAEQAFAFVEAALQQDGGRRHSGACDMADVMAGGAEDGRWRVGPGAMLDDRAWLASAALALHQASGEADWLARAGTLADEALAHHADSDGACFIDDHDAGDLTPRPKNAFDNPNPSGNGVLMDTLARLFWLTGDGARRDQADAIGRAFAGEARRNGFAHATVLDASARTESLTQVVVAGPPGAAADGLVAAVRRHGGGDVAWLRVKPDEALPAGHPACGKTGGGKSGAAAAYVCHGPVCGLPLEDATALTDQLAQRHEQA
ncbi:MAG: thioredoxin domain-containing protein [Alphaproteobacteria bacterium]